MGVLLVVAQCLTLAITALNLESTAYRVLGCSLVIALFAADMSISHTGTGYSDYTLGCTLGGLILDAIRFLLLTRPLEEYRHESDKVPAYQLPYIQRFFWLMSIGYRGIGWSFKANHSVPSVEPHHLTRRAFVTSRLLRAFVYFLLFEAVQLYIHCNPVFSSEAPLLSQGYFLGWINVMIILWRIYVSLNWMYSLVAVVAVGTTLHEPCSWPAPFGEWKDAYTIRRFWGRTWHQFTRHTFTLFGPHPHKHRPWDRAASSDSSVTKAKEHEPWIKSYIRLCNAFLCSAFMHTCGDVVLQFKIWENASIIDSPRKANHANVIGFSVLFFLLQPVGVLIEDAVMESGKRIGLRKRGWMKVVGYLWVLVWIRYSMHSWVQGQKNAMFLAYPAAEVRVTVLERIAKKLFGKDLAATIRPWFMG
ncbi:membrane bound O-acyl transferase family-domain-containing protein [Pisolithus marmoratus]|nr:membrane bound O-acyl transferase family-domain-containing protein [Pisolithus marmoratus]